METCIACSMPLTKKEDFGSETENGSVCIHCTNSDGGIKSCEEVFDGGVQFFLSTVASGDRTLAEKLSRKTMKNLPYWQNKICDCLEGEEVSDEKYAEAIKKLQSNVEN